MHCLIQVICSLFLSFFLLCTIFSHFRILKGFYVLGFPMHLQNALQNKFNFKSDSQQWISSQFIIVLWMALNNYTINGKPYPNFETLPFPPSPQSTANVLFWFYYTINTIEYISYSTICSLRFELRTKSSEEKNNQK